MPFFTKKFKLNKKEPLTRHCGGQKCRKIRLKAPDIRLFCVLAVLLAAGAVLPVLYVRHGDVQNGVYMLIVQRVEHIFALAAAFYYAAVFKTAQLVADGRLGHAQRRGDVLHAHLPLCHNAHHLYAGRVSQHFKKSAQRLNLNVSRHCFQRLVHRLLVLRAEGTVYAAFHLHTPVLC